MRIDVEPLVGQHCETTATGTLLNQLGVHLSEPMLFGLGAGLSFLYWKSKAMPTPFLGGRVKPNLLTENIARNLGLDLVVLETTSAAKAWRQVKNQLDEGRAVGLKLDCYHLDYFTQPFHFAGHYVAIVGYDEEQAFLVDTVQQGTRCHTSLESLSRARAERGPMASKNLSYTITHTRELPELGDIARKAIRATALAYLSPPIGNMSYKGIQRAAKELPAWFDRSPQPQQGCAEMAMMMEQGGTGGALFRNLYRDFLAETANLTGDSRVAEAADAFTPIAAAWSQVAQRLASASSPGDRSTVQEVSALLSDLATREWEVMNLLAAV